MRCVKRVHMAGCVNPPAVSDASSGAVGTNGTRAAGHLEFSGGVSSFLFRGKSLRREEWPPPQLFSHCNDIYFRGRGVEKYLRLDRAALPR